MTRDPYYQKILDGLAGPFDPSVFEECAVDLLREEYPTAVPIAGGSDAGMDGAIADAEGEAYPVVVTTANDVLRNLTRSLESYLEHGGKRRRIVVATSQKLTAKRRRHLEARSREKGFVLVQLYERRAIADRLYRNRRWVRDLLQISGEPSALSEMPRTRRPLRDVDLVGRESDLRWLRETPGDVLLVGQPGSGKTYLALQLVREGKALFLASEDEGRVADALRELQPSIVVVDDAHVDRERLVRLRHLRDEIGAEFRIFATAWPGAEDAVAAALGEIPSSQVHGLELMTRREILQVLRAIGISEPDDDPYLGELVRQAANKPGLAVTLGSLWLRGEGREVLTGQAIRRSLIPALQQVLGQDPTSLLACFALGGDGGMSLEAVGEFLGLGREEVHRRATEATHGGVLSARSGDVLSVEPEVLRSALLQEVFFTSPVLGDYRALLAKTPNRSEAIETLVEAALRGVAIPRDELRELLPTADTTEAWRGFARLSTAEGSWVLEKFERGLAEIADALLETVPMDTIQHLLREAEEASASVGSDLSPPLQALRIWLQEILPAGASDDQIERSLKRRELLISGARRYLDAGGVKEIGVQAICLALSPRLEVTRADAVGPTFRDYWGALPGAAVPRFLEMWSSVRQVLTDAARQHWSSLRQLLDSWTYIDALSPGRDRSEEERKQYRSFPERILRHLAAVGAHSPGLARELKRYARKLEVNVDFVLDGDFETLFPLQAENSDEKETQLERARELAARWSVLPASDASHRLSVFQAETGVSQTSGSEAAQTFFATLADAVDAPESWLSTFLDQRLNSTWVRPFLERLVREKRPGWDRSLRRCLESPDYASIGVEVVLPLEDLQPDLLGSALASAPTYLVKTACRRRAVPLKTLRLLFAHERQEVALTAAVAEWCAENPGSVRPEILEEWKECILRCPTERELDRLPGAGLDYGLKQILASEHDLAFSWLRGVLARIPKTEWASSHGLYAAAIGGLAPERRAALLDQIQPGHSARPVIRLLVADSLDVFGRLLSQDGLAPYHLSPLEGKVPNPLWIGMARLALAHGFSGSEVAQAAFLDYDGTIAGFGQEHWTRWKTGFQTLLETTTGEVREVAELGLAEAQRYIKKAAAKQREFELTGRF